jgi:VanZ family protein
VTPHQTNTKQARPGFFLYIVPTLLYVTVIFWLGAVRTNVEVPHGFLPEDKFKHFLAFALLVVLLFRTLRYQWPSESLRRLVILAVAGSSAIGALLEAWQLLFPYRSAEFADWVADTLGALVAGLLVMFWARSRRHRVDSPATTDSSTQVQ